MYVEMSITNVRNIWGNKYIIDRFLKYVILLFDISRFMSCKFYFIKERIQREGIYVNKCYYNTYLKEVLDKDQ